MTATRLRDGERADGGIDVGAGDVEIGERCNRTGSPKRITIPDRRSAIISA